MSDLASARSPALGERADLLIVPLGATEQHGPHLPLGTDTMIAVALAQRLATRRPDLAMVAPPVPYGSSGEHQAFPGTLSIGRAATETVLVELGRSATETFDRVLLVSAHGGNAAAVRAAVARLRAEGRDVRAWSPAEVWQGDAHAGELETSVMLALAPDDVALDRAAVGNPAPLGELIDAMMRGGVAAVSDNGVLGDPTGASAARGEDRLRTAVDALERLVDEWPTAARPDFPPRVAEPSVAS